MPDSSVQPSTATRPRSVGRGVLFDGLMDCYVLSDGRRVVSQRGEVAALTRATSGSKHGDLDRFLARLPKEYAHLTTGAKVEFEIPIEGGGARVALGREGCEVVDHLRAYADSFVAGKLRRNQEHLGRNAYSMVSALAKVGIEALIDEACGYKRTPEERTQAQKFAAFFTRDASKWEERFTPGLVRALAPLYGTQYLSGSYPRCLWGPFGAIYEMVFGADVAVELRRRNPNHETYNHHQFLQPRAANDLRNELDVVKVLAEQSRTKDEFWRRMRSHYRGEPLQTAFL